MAVHASNKARKNNVLPRLEVIMDVVLERYERIRIDDPYRKAFQRISKLRLCSWSPIDVNNYGCFALSLVRGADANTDNSAPICQVVLIWITSKLWRDWCRARRRTRRSLPTQIL